jgi:hypothetical protein
MDKNIQKEQLIEKLLIMDLESEEYTKTMRDFFSSYTSVDIDSFVEITAAMNRIQLITEKLSKNDKFVLYSALQVNTIPTIPDTIKERYTAKPAKKQYALAIVKAGILAELILLHDIHDSIEHLDDYYNFENIADDFEDINIDDDVDINIYKIDDDEFLIYMSHREVEEMIHEWHYEDLSDEVEFELDEQTQTIMDEYYLLDYNSETQEIEYFEITYVEGQYSIRHPKYEASHYIYVTNMTTQEKECLNDQFIRDRKLDNAWILEAKYIALEKIHSGTIFLFGRHGDNTWAHVLELSEGVITCNRLGTFFAVRKDEVPQK